MSESLRDQLSAALEKHETAAPETPAAQETEAGKGNATEEPQTPKADSPTPTEAQSSDPAKPGRTAGRARDEQGRLLPGKADPAAKVQATQPPAEQPPARAPLARPSSWKKEFWPLWDKLTKGEALSAEEAYKLAEYNLQRENEAAKGVSTYKTEFDRAKPLLDAIAPHSELFRQYNIDPAQQIGRYIEIHKGLALGSPEQKLGMLLRIAQDYQIPLQGLFVQQNGQVYFNPQVQPYQMQAQQPASQQQQQDPRAVYREIIAEERAAEDIARMEKDTKTYPYFATVKDTMRGLLTSGLAEDLPSAYEKALPLHPDIWDAIQEQKRVAEEAERKAKEAAKVAAAKAANVSPRSATPTSGAPGGKKGLRSSYEESFSDAESRV